MPNAEEMDNARLGVLHLFSKANCDSYLPTVVGSALGAATPLIAFHGEQNALAKYPGSGALGTYTPSPSIAGTPLTHAKVAEGTAKVLVHGMRGLLDLVEKWRKTPPEDLSLTDRIMAYIKDDLVGAVEHLVLGVAKAAAGALIPLFKTSYELADAIKSLVEAVSRRYRHYAAGKGVRLRDGLPAIAVGGVVTALERDIGFKTVRALKGAWLFIMDVTSLVTGPALAVAKSIMGLSASIAEEIAKLAVKLYEIYVTRQFIDQARRHLSEGSIHRDADRFNEWYRAGVERVPAIAAATIRSGLCGDKMRFLQMIDPKGAPISQAEYDKAFSYLERVGKQAGELLGGYSVTIRSADPAIDRLLRPGKLTFNEADDPHLAARASVKLKERELAGGGDASRGRSATQVLAAIDRTLVRGLGIRDNQFSKRSG